MITFQKFNKSNYTQNLIVTDGKLAQLYNLTGDNVFLLPQGESAKCLQCVQQLCSWLLSRQAQKDQTVVAVGGGSVGDAVGFSASVYKRGIKLLHIPTTLVAQIDSSIGGKTAVNLDGVKNVLGTFYNADTLIDTGFLNTLEEQQWRNGYGELLKYRMLSCQINEVALQGNMDDIVAACVNFKQQVCAQDPTDNNQRKILNFGHTVGHALELSVGIAHGEAVANGLYFETLLATKLGMCSEQYLKHWQREIQQHFVLRQLSSQNLQLITQDKKNTQGKVCFVLPTGDKFVLKYLPPEQVLEILCND